MNTSNSPDIALQIVELHVPILRYQKWLDLKFSEENEKKALEILEKNLDKAIDFATSTNVQQLKIAAPVTWKSLDKAGFTPTVYRISIDTEKLPNMATVDVDIQKTNQTDKIAPLIISHFRYHSEVDPQYFTHTPEQSATEFMSLASEAISLGNAFLLVASVEDKPIGFLYGENGMNGGTLDELYIIEAERCKGYGTALLSASRFNFNEAGSLAVEAYVSSKIPAVTFYNARGFTKSSVNWVRNLDENTQ